jgi:hypothetical protein
MKAITENRFRLYLSLSILTGTLGMILGPEFVTQAEASIEQPACLDVRDQVEPIQSAAEAIAEDPRQTVESIQEILTSLVQSIVEETERCVIPSTNR